MTLRLTVAYITFRQHPRFEWFCNSFAREVRTSGVLPSEVQVVVIDGRLWEGTAGGTTPPALSTDRLLEMARPVPLELWTRFEFHPPKPSPWQGPWRKTKKDYFCAASVRNTAFCYARAPHVAFVDDLSVLLPGWLEAHLAAARGGYVLAGTTCKNKNIVVDDAGAIVSFDVFPPGQDSRLKLAGASGRVRISGGSLFGGTFSVPLEAALRCNGVDEINDIIGGEDYDFGIRLERAGVPIFLSTAGGTIEDEDGHHTQTPMVRLDKPWLGPDGPYSSNYLLNKLLRETTRTWTTGNDFTLRDMRDVVLAGGEFPRPSVGLTTHWVDGQDLAEM